MDLLMYYFVIHILISAQGFQSNNITINPKVIDGFEKSNASFECAHIGSSELMTWSRKDKSNICVYSTSTCERFFEQHNRTACSCTDSPNKTSVTLQISNITSADHNTTWICTVTYQSGTEALNAYLMIKVPVKTLTIMPVVNNIDISENERSEFTCNTSYSRPVPKIRWILEERPKSTNRLLLIGEQTNNTNTIGLTSAESIVNYKSNRTHNGWKLYCTVAKSEVQNEEVASKNITLNVTYPPDSSLMINGFLSNGYYYVIDKNNGTLTCKINGGNPKPLLRWTKCVSNESYAWLSSFSTNESETNTLTWQAMAHADGYCICQSIQMERNDSLSIHVEVMYPPTIPTLTFYSLEVSGRISVLLDKELVLDCESKSKPPPTYQWTANNVALSGNKTLHIRKTNESHEGQYTCAVKNTMDSSDRVQTGSNNRTIEIHVLYPPSIHKLENLILIEGDQLNVSCRISHGNPSETIFRWTSEGNITSSSQYLTITNISRTDDMNYNCTVYNIMTPTGRPPVKGTDSAIFYLSVEYIATIKEFFVEGYVSERNVIVNETDIVTLICYIDSKPISNSSLRFRADKTLVWTESNNLNYTLRSAKCTDAGVYVCHGKNKHNKDVGTTQQLNMYIRCSPRAIPNLPHTVNITSAKNVSATIHFPFIAYPTPDTAIWQKYSISNWINLTSNNIINISRIEMNESLTIFNIKETDFGRYRLIISNDVGTYTQEFYINAEDKPNSPTGFHVINELTTATAATVQWLSSFDGGKPQQFVLNYSKAHQDIWLSKHIDDTGEKVINNTINGLSSDSIYYIFLYSKNSIGPSKMSERLEVQTKAIHAKTGRNIIGIVVGSVCGVIGAMLLVTSVIWFFRKRRNENVPDKMIYQNVPTIGHKESAQTKRSSLIRETRFFDEDLQEVDDVPHIAYERTEYNNSPEKIKEIDTIRVSELFQYVLGQTEDDFAIVYQQIPTELQSSIAFARKPENIALNRYNGIFPYDHSRVKIPTIPDFFMNACYIDGYKRRNAYIASLGPTEKTTNNFITFWQMVWYEKSDIIVMLTNLREPSGMKCEQYWPDSGTSATYGEICVSSVNTAIFSEFTVKKFLLSKGKVQRPITHLHFTAWPDKTVPEDTTILIEFRHQMKTTATSSSGPIIVHCSAGIGRTGTLIAFDRLVAEGQDKHGVNIFECVKSMRKQRVKMVQTLEQYIYIYKALVGTLCFESSYMTVKDLCSLVGTPKHLYSKEYQQLKQTVDTVKKDEKDAFKGNENQTAKNRPGADVPGNRFRVFLNLNREHEDSDYINAVYINSFVKKEFFILAQTPLPCATEDFICLIYQEDCTCVVSMNDQKDSYQKIGKYLPDGDKTLKIGHFKVSCSVLETKHHYTLQKMKICYEGRYERGEKIVYHFQYTQWLAEMEIPDNNVEFVQFVKDVHQYACELGDERSHVLAHCLKANERSGLFCAVLIILEKLDKENQVNISNTIRHLRTRRRSAITSMEQLQFCYQAASVYAKQLKN